MMPAVAAEVVDIKKVLEDPAASTWLKATLRSALAHDSVDAANDSEVLAQLLAKRCEHFLRHLTRPNRRSVE
jgi:hypothetical protein